LLGVFSFIYLFLISADGGTCRYKEKLSQCFPCCTRFHRNLEEKKTSAEKEGPKKVPEREREREGQAEPIHPFQIKSSKCPHPSITVPSPHT
jgi:hypothetical protein